MKWNELSEIQRNALVAEEVMGWQWIAYDFYDASPDDQLWLLPDGQSVTRLTPGEWTWHIEEPGVYPEGSPFPLKHKDNHILPTWIPHYTTDMSTAWLIVKEMAARFNPKDPYAYEPFIRFTADLLGDREEIYPSYGCMAGIAKWTPEQICLAALKSVGVEIED